MITQADLIPAILPGKAMLFSPHQEGLVFLRSQIPFKEEFVDSFASGKEASDALRQGKYSIILVDYTSRHPDAREVLVQAKSMGIANSVFVLAHSPNVYLSQDVWKLGNDHTFYFTGKEQDGLTQTLEIMFVDASPIRWVNSSRYQCIKMRNKLKGKKNKNLLIIGEPGTAKLSLAQIAHCRSERHNEPFVFANCKTAPDRLRLDWTEDDSRRFKRNLQSMLRASDQGTLFLHEVDKLDLPGQRILAEVIKEREYNCLPEGGFRKFTGVIIGSLTSPAESLIQNRRLAKELVETFDGHYLNIPSLAEFRDDIPNMAADMLKTHCMISRRPVMTFTKEAQEALKNHIWERNVRELFCLIRQSAEIADRKWITAYDLYLGPKIAAIKAKEDEVDSLRMAIRRNSGNKQAAANELGISRKTLYNRMKKFGIPQDYE